MRLKKKLASAALVAALIAGGSVATSTAAHAAPTSSDSGYTADGGYTSADKFWGSGSTRYRAVCERAIAAKKTHVIRSGGKNVKASCARGGGPRDSHLWYGVVTWREV